MRDLGIPVGGGRSLGGEDVRCELGFGTSLIQPAIALGASNSSVGEAKGAPSCVEGRVVFRLIDARRCGSPRLKSGWRNSQAPGSDVVANRSLT